MGMTLSLSLWRWIDCVPFSPSMWWWHVATESIKTPDSRVWNLEHSVIGLPLLCTASCTTIVIQLPLASLMVVAVVTIGQPFLRILAGLKVTKLAIQMGSSLRMVQPLPITQVLAPLLQMIYQLCWCRESAKQSLYSKWACTILMVLNAWQEQRLWLASWWHCTNGRGHQWNPLYCHQSHLCWMWHIHWLRTHQNCHRYWCKKRFSQLVCYTVWHFWLWLLFRSSPFAKLWLFVGPWESSWSGWGFVLTGPFRLLQALTKWRMKSGSNMHMRTHALGGMHI